MQQRAAGSSPSRPFQITVDTSAVNARGSLVDMNLIERWHAEGRVEIHVPRQVLEEIRTHRDAKGRALYSEKAEAFGSVAGEADGRPGAAPGDIARLLFPHTKPEAMTGASLIADA